MTELSSDVMQPSFGRSHITKHFDGNTDPLSKHRVHPRRSVQSVI